MRTRLARLLLAAARRLDRYGSVVPQGATRTVEIAPPGLGQDFWDRYRDRAIPRRIVDRFSVGEVFGPSGGQVIPWGRRDEDTVGPIKLSEGGRVCHRCLEPLERLSKEVPDDSQFVRPVPGPWICPNGHDQHR